MDKKKIYQQPSYEMVEIEPQIIASSGEGEDTPPPSIIIDVDPENREDEGFAD